MNEEVCVIIFHTLSTHFFRYFIWHFDLFCSHLTCHTHLFISCISIAVATVALFITSTVVLLQIVKVYVLCE